MSPLTSTDLLTPFLTGQYAPYDGKLILTNAGLTVAGIDASSFAYQILMVFECDMVDVTRYDSPSGYREYVPGRATANITLDMFTGDPTVDSTFQSAYDNRTEIPVQVTPRDAPPAPGNPAYEITCIVRRYARLQGNVGVASTSTVELESAGDLVVTDQP